MLRPDGADAAARARSARSARAVPNIMLGYWNDAGRDREVLRDGWLRTGDLGHMDEDGFLYIDGRAVDMIKVGAFRVSPQEIEEVIAALAGRRGSRRDGDRRRVLGQAIKAVIVPRDGAAARRARRQGALPPAPGDLQGSEGRRVRDALPRTVVRQDSALQTGLRGSCMAAWQRARRTRSGYGQRRGHRAHLRAPARDPREGRCRAAASSSPCRAASTARSAAALCVQGARPGARLRPDAAGARFLGLQHRARPAARRASRHQVRSVRHRAGARGHRLLPAGATRPSARVFPDYGDGWKNKIVISGGLEGPRQPFPARRADAGRRDAAGAPRPARVPADRRRDQLQAAHPQDGRVLPRRPPQLRGHRHAEPARVRPGLLREERRRQRRREADRAPVQDAGLRARAPPEAAGRDLQRDADHRHLQPGAGPGRVLFRAAVPADGPGAVGAQPRLHRRRARARRSASRDAQAANVSTRTSRRSAARRATCT